MRQIPGQIISLAAGTRDIGGIFCTEWPVFWHFQCQYMSGEVPGYYHQKESNQIFFLKGWKIIREDLM